MDAHQPRDPGLAMESDPEKLVLTVMDRLSSRPPVPMDLGVLTPAAVALLLLTGERGTSVLFTVRTDTVEHHKSEISFPGGRVDEEDSSELSAALRETWEEIGVPASSLTLLGRMDDFRSISGYRVSPFVFHLKNGAPSFNPHPGEVSEIIEVPLSHLVDPVNHRSDPSISPLGHPVEFFHWDGKVIWGLTGAILRHFLEIAFDFQAGEEDVDE